jgi:hypothetical protein
MPAPADPARPVALVVVATVGATAAGLLTVGLPGLGWLLVGLVAAAGLALVARGRGLPPTRWLWAGAALALLGVGTLRAADWLFLLCVPTAAACASIAMAGGRSARGLLVGSLAPLLSAVRGLPWFFRGAAALRRGAGGGWLRMAAAIGVTAALLLVFGSLFAGADPTFAKLVDALIPSWDVVEVVSGVTRFVVFSWGALGAAYLASRPPALEGIAPGPRRPVRRMEWMVPVVLLDVLFVSFVAVQLRALFGGDAYVMRTAGLTYAEYARGGFWQLVMVTLLTLAVIAVAARRGPRASVGDQVAVRVALGVLAGLTLVIVASALARMAAYEQAYGLTRLRLLVAACEIWLGLVFVYILAAGILRRGGWFARAVVGTGVAMLLGIALMNPDRLIAERNIDRYERGGELDVAYLGSLSADAAPALDRLPVPARNCALSPILDDQSGDAWYEFNWGRWRARQVAPPTGAGFECWRPVR